MPVRKELAVETIFNLLGPLTNPAGAKRQVMGVTSQNRLELAANALSALGARRALVVSSDDGLDEMSICAPTQIFEVSDGNIQRYQITPEDFGLQRANLDEIKGGSPTYNAQIARAVLAGEQGPQRDVAVLNAAGAIYAAGRVNSLVEGKELAEQALDSGAGTKVLERYVKYTQEQV
jgi:anthranilate phosphoribosyltransferase